jgi:hypothetical protein
MKNVLRICTFVISTFILMPSLIAQLPTDALMMDKGQICLAALYSNDTWDEYWEGTLKRTNGNIGTLTRQTVLPMFTLGITDRINVTAALPWIQTKASGGQMRGSSGFQDLGLWVKATALEELLGTSVFTIHTVVGLAVPTSNYLEDYVPFSIGLGCPDLSLRGTLQYRMDMGMYVRGSAAYMIRGNAKIERDYYYTTHGVYSDEVDMPNAVTYAGTLGWWLLGNTLQVEATYDAFNTLGGFDMRRQDVGFPSNNMEFTRIGAFIHYYLPFLPGMGIIAQGNQILTGRNIGMSTAFTAGISYQFGLWNKHEMETPSN